ncbi:NmrA-like family protein [Xylariales sp. PMI_506]|nr:NmrA-like family protein [Xylariales sp. PMI_506]
MVANLKIKKVALCGASGLIGSIVLSALLEAKLYEVTVLSRSSSDATFPEGVRVVKVSYSDSTGLVEALRGQDAVISTVGATGFSDQKTIIDAAIEAGVMRFIPSELSSNTRSDAVRQLVPVFEAKQTILDYLKEKQSSGLTWTALATGPLLDWGLSSGFLGFDLTKKTATIWDAGDKHFSATNEKDLGNAVVSVLQHPVKTTNQYLYVASIETTQNAILAALENHSGVKWTTEHVSTDEQVAAGRKLVSEGDFTGMYALVRASAWGNVPGIRSHYSVDESFMANDLLGIPKSSLNETVKRVLSG